MDREKILNKLTVLDFALVDLHLYLNTHPNDREAIEKYNDIAAKADSVRMMYEENFGPLCSFRSSSDENNFTWIDEPWPWQNKFNYNLPKEVC